mmetsp:Transcript_727/g.945  ORF Transcript_727/g.945 Transcript_727/m.945 type:complete len:529 (-) Transcript_727:129-1715(-)|eukprot:CAMPEP_0185723592 /NCGR_PEP_ID=MMETSP1171-20130828/386_1 /TAXON_ID=374046 /ORGANISM="Helicotheca tamensis, Strain CCMP826" /LENGTH=528 /DNA_ID=CAMNT_0028391323 /DNA_START=44 /DNA_END=1630 /DNA_ORIENTATION=-
MKFFSNYDHGGGAVGNLMALVGLLVSLQKTNASVEPTIPTVIADKRLTEATMSQKLRNMEYAVRGQVVITADRINDELKSDDHPYSFNNIVYTNIGNPHSVGQKPLTWPRQVMALVDLPDECGVDHPDATKLFPSDAIERAREIKHGLGGMGTGAYSHSQGARCFREDIAKFIEERDGGVPCDPDCLFMSNGASSAINFILTALIADETCGVMIPIPQYPIYSATIDLLGGQRVGYYLDERKGWDLNMEELERAFQDAQNRGIHVNSFVLINPGNPTGQVLSKKAVQDIVKFCAKHKLVLLADEVYQENVYDDNAEFVSCKKAASDAGLLKDDGIELVSFHSTSKGLFGECGRRGGYMELVGFHAEVKDQIYKLASSGLCSGLPGQIMTSLMVRGPAPGEESYESHEQEKTAIFESLKRRSKLVSEGLNSIPGFSCQTAQGAMYCFPSIEIPEGAKKAAAEQGMAPDTFYALSLLENTGICVVPASGFGQEEGRLGFRTTFLPSEGEMERAVGLFKKHHEEFCAKYSA